MSQRDGFIALVSAVVISVLLIGFTFAVGTSGFGARFRILTSEYKERSRALAEACADAALLKLAKDAGYAPAAECVAVGESSCPGGPDVCTVLAVQRNMPSAGKHTITTRATFQRAVTNIKVVVNAADLSTVSWEEVPNLP